MMQPKWRRYVRFWGSNIPEDVDDELRFHIDMRVNEYIARGMSRADATQLATSRFGSFDRARVACVDINTEHARMESRTEMVSDMVQDAAFAARLLRRQRLPALVAVLCLALGIGATTTMFSIANTLLLRPLPYPNGDRLVSLLSIRNGVRSAGAVSSYPDFMDWRARQHSFTDIAALGQASYTIVQSTPVRIYGSVVSPQLFDLLGARAEYGRLFRSEEDMPGAEPVVLVSHGLAERRLGGAAKVVGTHVNIGGRVRTIVGVIPDLMRFPTGSEIWTPLPRDRSTNRASRNLEVFALLRPGVPLDAARRDMLAVSGRLATDYPGEDAEIRVDVDPLRERFVGGARAGLIAMACATLLVLLVACTNVAGLQLARASIRAREIAVRSALGAARGRVLRQLLTESVLLSVLGGACGVGLALAARATVVYAIAGEVPPWMTFQLDLRALGFTLAVSMLVGIAFGVAPAMRLSRLQPSDVLRGGRRSVGPAGGFLQNAFVVAQIALSVVLVICAALAIESVVHMQNVPLGLDPKGVYSFRVSAQGPRYQQADERARMVQELEHRVALIPGVEVAGATTYAPIAGCCSQFGTTIEGQPATPGHDLMVTGNMVTPGFFRALRIPLLAGRELTERDDASAPKVVMISETFAKRFWPAGDAIGHRIETGNGMASIIAIVGDIKQGRLIDPPEPQFYRPHAQDPWDAMTFIVRVRGDNPARILPDVRRALHDVDPTLAVFAATTLDKTIDSAVAPKRLFGELFAALASVALFLAAAGVYAVMSFYVSQRTQEIGLRMALGAESTRVVWLVLSRGAALALAGGLLGLAGGAAAARALAHELYAVNASEPVLYLAAALALGLVAALATVGPARRASTVDPMVALRAD